MNLLEEMVKANSKDDEDLHGLEEEMDGNSSLDAVTDVVHAFVHGGSDRMDQKI